MNAKQKQKLHHLKDQVLKDLLNLSQIEKQIEYGESELESHSEDKEDLRIIRKGMLNILERILLKQAVDIAKEEEEIDKMEAKEMENTTKHKGM